MKLSYLLFKIIEFIVIAICVFYSIFAMTTALLISQSNLIFEFIVVILCEIIILGRLITRLILYIGNAVESPCNRGITFMIIVLNLFWIMILISCIVLLIQNVFKYGSGDMAYILSILLFIGLVIYILCKSIYKEILLIKSICQ